MHGFAAKMKYGQEQMDIISQLCNERYLTLVKGDSGNDLLLVHVQSSNNLGVMEILRQDHPQVTVGLKSIS
jgi:hypothetical protein